MLKRGQAATELLIILGLGLAILLSIFSISQKTTHATSSQFEISKARSVVEDLANAAELVYRQGIGSKTKVYLQFPNNVNHINFTGQLIQLNIQAGGDSRDVYRTVDFTVENGTITLSKGNRIIYVVAGKDFVYFTEDVSQAAQYCGNIFPDGTEDCDNTHLGGNSCLTIGYDAGNLSCQVNCVYNQTQCTGPGTKPDSITDLLFVSSDAYSIYWTWTNPTNPDFKESIIYINGSNVDNTSDAFYTAVGLTPLTNYTLIVHTVDYGNNVNDTDVIDTANSTNGTAANTTAVITMEYVPLTQCNAEDSADKGSLTSACDGSYPGVCDTSNDYLTCNDGFIETHEANKQSGLGKYGGVNLTVFNSSIDDCDSISSVQICYEWWTNGALGDCDVSVDADGGSNFTAATTTCPGLVANPGVICTNVTALETWTCNTFYNTTGTRAVVKSEVQHSGGTGTRTTSWDALYYNVTYVVVT